MRLYDLRREPAIGVISDIAADADRALVAAHAAADGVLRHQFGNDPIDRLEPISDHAFTLTNSDTVQLIFEPSALVLRLSNGDEERVGKSEPATRDF